MVGPYVPCSTMIHTFSQATTRSAGRKPPYAGTTTALQKPTSLRTHPSRSAPTRAPIYPEVLTSGPPTSLRAHPSRSAHTRAPTLPEVLTSGPPASHPPLAQTALRRNHHRPAKTQRAQTSKMTQGAVIKKETGRHSGRPLRPLFNHDPHVQPGHHTLRWRVRPPRLTLPLPQTVLRRNNHRPAKIGESSNPSISKCPHPRAYLPRGFNLGPPSRSTRSARPHPPCNA